VSVLLLQETAVLRAELSDCQQQLQQMRQQLEARDAALAAANKVSMWRALPKYSFLMWSLHARVVQAAAATFGVLHSGFFSCLPTFYAVDGIF
jgi:hypothetical protein